MISISLEFYYFVTRHKYYWLIVYVLIEKETCARAEKPDPVQGASAPVFPAPFQAAPISAPSTTFSPFLLQTFLLMFRLLNRSP